MPGLLSLMPTKYLRPVDKIKARTAAILRKIRAPGGLVNRIRPKDFSRRDIEFDFSDIWEERTEEWINLLRKKTQAIVVYDQRAIEAANRLGEWISNTRNPQMAQARKTRKFCLITRRGLRFTNRKPEEIPCPVFLEFQKPDGTFLPWPQRAQTHW